MLLCEMFHERLPQCRFGVLDPAILAGALSRLFEIVNNFYFSTLASGFVVFHPFSPALMVVIRHDVYYNAFQLKTQANQSEKKEPYG